MDKLTAKCIAVLCIAMVFMVVAVSLVAERKLDRAAALAQRQEDELASCAQIIQAQGELIWAFRDQNLAVGSLLETAADTLQLIVYGPYSRDEVADLVTDVADVIREVNIILIPNEVEEISQAIVQNALAADIDPWLLLSVAILESNCRPGILGKSGEYGIMQVMPGTGAWIAGKLGYVNWCPEAMFGVRQNIQFGAYYLRVMIREFGGDLELGLLAYNRGSTGARRWLKKNIAIQHCYVARVLGIYQTLGARSWAA